MNPRDLPEVVAELIIEMHEVRSELTAINGRIDRLERTVDDGFKTLREEIRESSRATIAGIREEIRESSRATVDGIVKGFEPFLNRLLDHDDQLKNHESRLNNLENPQ